MADADPRIYNRSEVIAFRKTNERFGGLSNMAPGFPIRLLGERIRTSEALYQACRFPHLPHVQRQILDEISPMTAKMRGKPYRQQSRPDWDAVRIPIMKWCLRVKLAQNWSKFGDLLLATGDRPIVEDSRKDDFWGAKVGEDGILRGRNVLGRLLMELREKLKADAEALTTVPPPPLSNFTLLSREMPVVIRAPALGLPPTQPVEQTPALLDLIGEHGGHLRTPQSPVSAEQAIITEDEEIIVEPESATLGITHREVVFVAAAVVALAAVLWLVA